MKASKMIARGKKSRFKPLLILPLLLVTINVFLAIPIVGATAPLRGVVSDDKGAPLENARIFVWSRRDLLATGVTDSNGSFEIQVKSATSYSIFALADKAETEGIDYLPGKIDTVTTDASLSFILFPAASMILEGDIQFVESEELPTLVLYTVVDPSSNEVISFQGFLLRFGTSMDSQSSFLGLDPFHLLVPANIPFKVVVNCSILIESSVSHRSFDVSEPSSFSLDQGDRLVMDLKRYNVEYNIQVSEQLRRSIESTIVDMESFGFYLIAQRAAASNAARYLSEAAFLYDEGKYVDSYDSVKRSFLILSKTRLDLAAMHSDSSASAYILIFFLGFTSVATAFLASNEYKGKILGSASIYAIALVSLFVIYPGSNIIPTNLFIESAAISMIISLTVAAILPRLLKAEGGGGRIPVRNILVPVFSIAKRNLRRRKLRFALTLTTITVLVMSFVALTSFSEGFGLLISRVANPVEHEQGIMIRARGYSINSPVFLYPMDLDSGWLERQPESSLLSLKVENILSDRPATRLNGQPMYGIVGIDSQREPILIGLDSVIREGTLPGLGGAAISEGLRIRMNLNINDSLSVGSLSLRLEGVFDDEAFLKLLDLDGSPYIPSKLVNINPPGEPPSYVLVSCEPSEVVVLNMNDALHIPLTGVSRVDIEVKDNADVKEFATRLALERGYLAWANAIDGIFFMRLSNYLEGKGLPLMIPWAIVVLNVVVTMLNSLYERRGEIGILSSVGLNPAQIASIFVAEALIIGVVAGGAGYLLGLSLYKVMTLLQISVEVHQKISAFWSLAAIGVAMTAVLIGAVVALRSSVVITPSLTRRWKLDEDRRDMSEPWEIPVPVKILPEETEGFVDFMVGALRDLEYAPFRKTSSIKLSKGSDGEHRIDFVYKEIQLGVGNSYSRNTLKIRRGPENVAVELISNGDKDWAHKTGSMIRLLAIEYSGERVGSGKHGSG